MKYTYMTRFSIFAIGVIFLLQVSQAFLVYNLSQTNIRLLQRELDSINESVYDMDLNFRSGAKEANNVSDVKFQGTTTPSIDTTIITGINGKGLTAIERDKSLVSATTLAMEEFVSKTYPINLQRIDSLAGIVLAQSSISLKFYSEIIDPKADKILETTLSASYRPSDVLYSRGIPLNVEQTKVLRLVVINPTWKIYLQIIGLLALSLLLSIFCVYNIHAQKKNLARQRQLASLKNDFFSEVSHEFKRPLAVLRQAISSLSNEKILLNAEKRARMLKIADEEILKMTSRTEMFLSLAQDDEGLFELHHTEFDLVKVVFDLADNAVDTTPGSPEIDVDNELKDPMIFADKEHIEQMLSNLIGNAIKYSKESSINISIRLYQENNYVCISVKDTGLGISKENLDVIFEKYSRVGKTNHVKGHGIGLNYVKRIIEKHGGTISVESELNIGSEFVVKLPLVKNT